MLPPSLLTPTPPHPTPTPTPTPTHPFPQLRSHMFGSPHTVDYCGVGGSAATVDNCFKTAKACDQSGTVFSGNYGQLPACTGPTPHWPSTGKGVIMSYVSGKGELAW